MSSLEALKNKIKGIDATKKITNAMKLVAASNLRKEKTKFEQSKSYMDEFYNIYRIISSEVENHDEVVNNNNVLWILVTSSFGLCGSFNIQVVKKFLANYQKGDKIVVIGKKGFSLLKTKKVDSDIVYFIDVDSKYVTYDITNQICEEILKYMMLNKFDKLNIIYTKFINSLTFEPFIFNVFPINYVKDNQDNDVGNYVKFQTDPKTILLQIKKQYFCTILYGSILESNVSENSSRRNSMDTASENAQSLKDDYLNLYNSSRQSKITEEINEIIGGSCEK